MASYARGSRLLFGAAGAALLLSTTAPAAFADESAHDATCTHPDRNACDEQTVVDAVATGRGAEAARLIRECGYATNAPVLGDLIFRAGVQATEPGADGSGFPDAVAVAFVDGGVPIVVASDAFRVAATKVAFAGLTPERAQLGAAAVAKTYALYAERGQVTSAPPATTSAAHAVF